MTITFANSGTGILLLLLATGSVPAAVGWHGDGSGVLAEAQPPRQWSDQENVLWASPMPNWGTGQPVACAGRVHVLSEPLRSAPILTCLDDADGSVLWQVEVDHLDEATSAELAALNDEIRQANVLQARHFAAVVANDAEAMAALQEEIAAAGCHSKRTHGKHIIVRPGEAKQYGGRLRDLRERGAGIPFWCLGGAGDIHHPGYSCWEGLTYAAPVADQSGVWVWLSPGVAAHYGPDGQQRWLRHIDPQTFGRELGGRWPDCKYTSSPVLLDGVLVVVGSDRIHGLDATTGEVIWESDTAHAQGWEPCPVLAIRLPGAAPAVIAHDGVVYRVSDGWPLLDGLPDPTDAGLIVHGATVVIQANERKGKGRFVAAWRLQPADPERWTAELLWEQDDYRIATDHDNRVPIAYDGTIYGSVGLVDLATGAVRVSAKKPFFHSHSSAWKVGDLLICHGPEDKTGRGGPVPPAVTRVCDPQTLEVLAVNRLSPAPVAGAKKEQLMHHSSRGELGWGPRGLQTIFATGDRLYIRSHDHLHCIGVR